MFAVLFFSLSLTLFALLVRGVAGFVPRESSDVNDFVELWLRPFAGDAGSLLFILLFFPLKKCVVYFFLKKIYIY